MGCSGSRHKERLCYGLSMEEGDGVAAPRALEEVDGVEAPPAGEEAGAGAGEGATRPPDEDGASSSASPAEPKNLGSIGLIEAMEIVQRTRSQLKKERILGTGDKKRRSVGLKVKTHVGDENRRAALRVGARVAHRTPEEAGKVLAALKAPDGTVAAAMLDVPVKKGDRKAALNAGKVVGKLFLALDQDGVRQRIAEALPGYVGHGKQLVKGDEPSIRIALFFDKPLGPLDHLTMLDRLNVALTLRGKEAGASAPAAVEDQEVEAAVKEEEPAPAAGGDPAKALADLPPAFFPQLPPKEELAATVEVDTEMEQALVRHLHAQLVEAGYAPQALPAPSADGGGGDGDDTPSLAGLLTLVSLLHHVDTTLRFDSVNDIFKSSGGLERAAANAAGASSLPGETVLELVCAGFESGEATETQRQMYEDVVRQAAAAFAGPEGTYRLSALSGGALVEAEVRGVNPFALLPSVRDVDARIKAKQEQRAREELMASGDVASHLFSDADFAAAARAAAAPPPKPFALVYPDRLGPNDWTNVWANTSTSPQTLRVRGRVLGLDAEQVFHHFYDPTVRALWDQFLSHCQRVKRFEELDADVLYSTFLSPPGLAPREFLELRQVQRPEPGTVVVLARSVSLPEVRANADNVRGTTLHSAYTFRTVDGGKDCEVTGVVQQNLGGYIPSFALRKLDAVIAEWMHLFITTARRAHGLY